MATNDSLTDAERQKVFQMQTAPYDSRMRIGINLILQSEDNWRLIYATEIPGFPPAIKKRISEMENEDRAGIREPHAPAERDHY